MSTAAEALREAVLFGAFLIGFPLALAARCGGLCWAIKKLRRYSMSSAINHRRRSHRSERRKASAFGGFKPAVSPSRSKYANKTDTFSVLTGLANLLTRRRSREKPKGGIRNEADQL